jgi:hypothetical protein
MIILQMTYNRRAHYHARPKSHFNTEAVRFSEESGCFHKLRVRALYQIYPSN